MRQRLGNIAATGLLGRQIARNHPVIAHEQQLPDPQTAPDVERKADLMRLAGFRRRRQPIHERFQIGHILRHHLVIGVIGQGRVKMRAVLARRPASPHWQIPPASSRQCPAQDRARYWGPRRCRKPREIPARPPAPDSSAPLASAAAWHEAQPAAQNTNSPFAASPFSRHTAPTSTECGAESSRKPAKSQQARQLKRQKADATWQ